MLEFLLLSFLPILSVKYISEDIVQHNNLTMIKISAVLKGAPNRRMLHTALQELPTKDVF